MGCLRDLTGFQAGTEGGAEAAGVVALTPYGALATEFADKTFASEE